MRCFKNNYNSTQFLPIFLKKSCVKLIEKRAFFYLILKVILFSITFSSFSLSFYYKIKSENLIFDHLVRGSSFGHIFMRFSFVRIRLRLYRPLRAFSYNFSLNRYKKKNKHMYKAKMCRNSSIKKLNNVINKFLPNF